jgi:hypothetical protein
MTVGCDTAKCVVTINVLIINVLLYVCLIEFKINIKWNWCDKGYGAVLFNNFHSIYHFLWLVDYDYWFCCKVLYDPLVFSLLLLFISSTKYFLITFTLWFEMMVFYYVLYFINWSIELLIGLLVVGVYLLLSSIRHITIWIIASSILYLTYIYCIHYF